MVYIAGIENNSIVDGEGWRYVIFTQGCSHKCKGCHNPHTWSFQGGKEFNEEEALNEIKSNALLDGITLSGGDPFFQAEELIAFVKEVKQLGMSVWAYTGFNFEEFLLFKNNCKCDDRINIHMINLLNYIDVLVDGPFIESKKSMECKYRGSTNQRIIDVKESLLENQIIEYRIGD